MTNTSTDDTTTDRLGQVLALLAADPPLTAPEVATVREQLREVDQRRWSALPVPAGMTAAQVRQDVQLRDAVAQVP